MLTSPWARAGAVVVLLVGLFGLAVWSGSLGPAPELGAYPGNEELAADYDSHVGDRVVVAGDVVSVDPLVVEVVTVDRGPVRYRVTDVDRPVEVGDGLWVFGVAGPDRTVEAQSVEVIQPWGPMYAYAVSMLAGLWVLVRILRDWRFDPDGLGLAPRSPPDGVGPSGPGGDDEGVDDGA